MKKNILAVCSAVAISGLSLAAQQPPSQTPPTQQTPPSQPAQRPPDPTTEPTNPSPQSPAPTTRSQSASSDMARTSTTLTGCLKAWDSRTMAPATGSGSGAGSAASPTSTAPASTGASGQFVLTNVERGSAASRPSGSSFLLKTSDSSVSFSQHLNHKVEVTGTLSDAAKGAGSSDTAGADRDASASGRVSTSDMKLPTLNVTALKMVSPTCGSGS